MSRFAFLCLGLAWLALLAACGNASGKTELTVWAMGREGEVVVELIPAFKRENPGIEVSVEQIPWTAAHAKLLTAFAGDATPDVAQLGNTWVPEFVALGALTALDGRVAATPKIAEADYFPGIWDSNVVDGRLYGIPWYVDTRLLFYRRDLLARAGFREPPTNWSEWRRAMQAVKAQVGPQRYATLLPLNEYEPLVMLALQQEQGMLRDDGRHGNFRSADFRESLGFYLGLFRDGLAPRLANTQISNVWDEFDRGYFSFYISGPWQIGEFKRRLPADRQSIWMTAPLPGPDGPGSSVAGGSSLVVFERSEKKDAAWKLIEYFSRPEVQIRFHALTGDLPPRRSSWASPELRGDPYARAFAEQLERVEPAPKVPEWERLAQEMRLVGERAVLTNMSVDAAAAEMDRRAEHILEKRRWMLDRQANR